MSKESYKRSDVFIVNLKAMLYFLCLKAGLEQAFALGLPSRCHEKNI